MPNPSTLKQDRHAVNADDDEQLESLFLAIRVARELSRGFKSCPVPTCNKGPIENVCKSHPSETPTPPEIIFPTTGAVFAPPPVVIAERTPGTTRAVTSSAPLRPYQIRWSVEPGTVLPVGVHFVEWSTQTFHHSAEGTMCVVVTHAGQPDVSAQDNVSFVYVTPNPGVETTGQWPSWIHAFKPVMVLPALTGTALTRQIKRRVSQGGSALSEVIAANNKAISRLVQSYSRSLAERSSTISNDDAYAAGITTVTHLANRFASNDRPTCTWKRAVLLNCRRDIGRAIRRLDQEPTGTAAARAELRDMVNAPKTVEALIDHKTREREAKKRLASYPPGTPLTEIMKNVDVTRVRPALSPRAAEAILAPAIKVNSLDRAGETPFDGAQVTLYDLLGTVDPKLEVVDSSLDWYLNFLCRTAQLTPQDISPWLFAIGLLEATIIDPFTPLGNRKLVYGPAEIVAKYSVEFLTVVVAKCYRGISNLSQMKLFDTAPTLPSPKYPIQIAKLYLKLIEPTLFRPWLEPGETLPLHYPETRQRALEAARTMERSR